MYRGQFPKLWITSSEKLFASERRIMPLSRLRRRVERSMPKTPTESPSLMPISAGSSTSRLRRNERIFGSGEVRKPGGPARSVAQTSPSGSTAPNTMNGKRGKNSRCCSRRNLRNRIRPRASICSATPTLRCIASSPSCHGELTSSFMTSSKHRGERETSSPGITHAANLGFEAGIGIALHTSIPNIFAVR
jgi:hypothetical protein